MSRICKILNKSKANHFHLCYSCPVFISIKHRDETDNYLKIYCALGLLQRHKGYQIFWRANCIHSGVNKDLGKGYFRAKIYTCCFKLEGHNARCTNHTGFFRTMKQVPIIRRRECAKIYFLRIAGGERKEKNIHIFANQEYSNLLWGYTNNVENNFFLNNDNMVISYCQDYF